MKKIWKIHPVVWAVLVCVGGAESQAMAADAPQIFSSQDTAQQQRGMTEAPLAYTSFAAMAESAVGELKLRVNATQVPADGMTTVDAELTLWDVHGQALDAAQNAVIEVSGGAKVLLSGETPNDLDINKMEGKRNPAMREAKTASGKLAFKILTPMQPGDVVVKVSVAGRTVMARLSALPADSKLFAVGMVEMQMRGYRSSPLNIQPSADGDGFDQEITNWRQEFGNSGDGYLAGRSALYLKGMISGKTLLTLSYDSDKKVYDRLFQDIDPDAMYPIYGDSSTRGIDAQSASKLYVRLDRGKSNILWGDYTSSSNDFTLSSYSRSLTGAKAHYEEGAITANAWAADTRTLQVVDEIRGAGMSGPYSLSSPNGVKGSEQVELLVRDRNQPSVILKSTTLTRFTDYDFEVFSGRIMFRAPIPSVDSNGNPVSIRVTYEVDDGGQRYVVAGADVVAKVSDKVALGASAAKDNNPQSEYQVAGVMAQAQVVDGLRLKAEYAESQGTPSAGTFGLASNVGDKGSAARVEAVYQKDKLNINAHAGRSDAGFHNPNAPITDGRSEAGIKVTLKATDALTLGLDVRENKQAQTPTLNESKARSVEATADYKVTPSWSVGGGLRYAKQDIDSLNQLGSACSYGLYSGTIAGYDGFNNAGFGINPNGNGSVYTGTGLTACGVGAVTPAWANSSVSNTGVFVRTKYDINSKFSVFAEAGRDQVSGSSASTLYSFGGEYRPYDLTRIYFRHEMGYAFSGLNGQGIGDKTSLTTFGVDTEYMKDGHLFSEYRLQDAANGREVQNAVGLRNGFHVADGVQLLTNAEIVSSHAMAVNTAAGLPAIQPANTTKALGVGVEYTPSTVYKASGRVEWRADNQATNYLTTLGVAAKVNRDWSLMAREYSSIVHYDAGGDTQQDRLQVGTAYRPVDNNRLDAIGMVDLRHERNTAGAAATVAVVPKRDEGILSLNLNYHPTRPWWLSGRMAYKQVDEILPGMTGATTTLVPSQWKALLLGGRIKYDITNRWTLGLNLSTLSGGPGGGMNARQYAWGPEVGYIVRDNLMVIGGYNLTGFTGEAAQDTGFDYTAKGWYVGLRWKFDEELFKTSATDAKQASNPSDK